MNNVSDLSEVLQEMPCGMRRAAGGELSWKGGSFRQVFSRLIFISVDKKGFMACFGASSLEVAPCAELAISLLLEQRAKGLYFEEVCGQR